MHCKYNNICDRLDKLYQCMSDLPTPIINYDATHNTIIRISEQDTVNQIYYPRPLQKECGGASICAHGRIKSTCKECDGASICAHGRQKSKCKAAPHATTHERPVQCVRRVGEADSRRRAGPALHTKSISVC